MNEEHYFEHFSPVEYVSNFDEFIGVIKIINFLNDTNPLSVYLYAYHNNKEILNYLIGELNSELKIYGTNYEKIYKLYY